jgi:cytochrome c553
MRAALILLVIMLGAAAVVWAARTPRADDKAVQPVALDPVARGKYLVTIMACADCHTPHNEKGELITEMLFAGHPEKAPLPVWEPAMLEKGILATIAPTLTAFAGPF